MYKLRHDITEAEQRVVQEVLEERVLVSGVVPIGETWAIYGSIPVDGEVIVAEFDNWADAQCALYEIAAAEQGSGHQDAPFNQGRTHQRGKWHTHERLESPRKRNLPNA